MISKIQLLSLIHSEKQPIWFSYLKRSVEYNRILRYHPFDEYEYIGKTGKV